MAENLPLRTSVPTLIPCVQWGHVLRRISTGDDAAVARLVREVMREFRLDGPGSSAHDEELACLSATYQRRRHFFYVLEDSSATVVGCGGISPLRGLARSAFTCELKKVYFRPDARGKGLGKWLLEACLSEARRIGYRRVYLETSRVFANAVGLYERIGFRRLEAPLSRTGHPSCCDAYYLLEL